jgi:hypothetical protein
VQEHPLPDLIVDSFVYQFPVGVTLLQLRESISENFLKIANMLVCLLPFVRSGMYFSGRFIEFGNFISRLLWKCCWCTEFPQGVNNLPYTSVHLIVFQHNAYQYSPCFLADNEDLSILPQFSIARINPMYLYDYDE